MKVTTTLMAAALLSFATAHAADGPPKMKPGLWEVISSFEAGRAGQTMNMTMQHCVGDTSDSLWDPTRAMPGGGQRTCGPIAHSRQGKAYVMETECREGETKVKTRMSTVASADKYETDMQFTYDPPRRGRSTGAMKVIGKFMGACPADLKPGAVRMTGMPVPGQVPATAK